MAARLAPLARSFYRRAPEIVAPELLGRYVVRDLGPSDRRVLRIVETEAYLGAPDRASHAWNGRRTERTASLFRPGGCAYVYLIYGLHHMLNVVTGSDTDGSAVLIRAGAPEDGAGRMRRVRGLAEVAPPSAIAAGPGRLCEALGIDRDLDRCWLDRGPLRITAGRPTPAAEVVRGPRVGIDYAGEAAGWPLRFAVAGDPCVSKPRLTGSPGRSRSAAGA